MMELISNNNWSINDQLQEKNVNYWIAQELIEQRLGVDPTPENIRRLAHLLTEFEKSCLIKNHRKEIDTETNTETTLEPKNSRTQMALFKTQLTHEKPDISSPETLSKSI